jgi:AcrR family transcriptional regulator
MARPSLSERHKAQTRREIAESALALFARHGYERVSAEAIAAESGLSLRTFYRYFPGKDAVLSPIVTDGIQELVEKIAARPPRENLATAIQRAYAEITPQQGQVGVQLLIGLFVNVPALRSRWLDDLRSIEAALIPVIRQRARQPLDDYQAHLTAAAAVTGLRVALEFSAQIAATEPLADTLGTGLSYLRDGAKL